jgi:16S rRNA (uracil1498-N3)-methyltransferase
VERADREALTALAALPGFLASGPIVGPGELRLDEDAAHHMRVRRLAPGEAVRVTDGEGRAARGTIVAIDKRGADVTLTTVHEVPAPAPLHLLAPVADRERMLWLAEKAAELGAASWRAVSWRRSRSVSPRGEGEAFALKVRARMVSALLQSGGAWLPRVEPDVPVDRLPGVVPADGVRLLLDVAGAPLLGLAAGSVGLWLALGPEGGVEPAERDELVAAGFHLASLGGGILRFETAGVAALAVARAARAARGALA